MATTITLSVPHKKGTIPDYLQASFIGHQVAMIAASYNLHVEVIPTLRTSGPINARKVSNAALMRLLPDYTESQVISLIFRLQELLDPTELMIESDIRSYYFGPVEKWPAYQDA